MAFKYFKIEDFACPCCGQNKISSDLVFKLDKAREISNIPFKISSGYRCEKHNKEVGGEPNSAHTKGLAVDIICKTSGERYAMIKALVGLGFTRIGVGNSFIHCDIDTSLPQNVIWTYYNKK